MYPNEGWWEIFINKNKSLTHLKIWKWHTLGTRSTKELETTFSNTPSTTPTWEEEKDTQTLSRATSLSTPSSQLRMPYQPRRTTWTEKDSSKVTPCNLQRPDNLTRTQTFSGTSRTPPPFSPTSSPQRRRAKWGSLIPSLNLTSWDKMREQSRKVMALSTTQYQQEWRANGKAPFSRAQSRTFQWGNGSSRRALARLVYMETPKGQANGKRRNISLRSWARNKKLDHLHLMILLQRWGKPERFMEIITCQRRRSSSQWSRQDPDFGKMIKQLQTT